MKAIFLRKQETPLCLPLIPTPEPMRFTMIRKYVTAAALALVLASTAIPSIAFAANPPAKTAPAPAKPQQPTYAQKHSATVDGLTQFRDALNGLPVDDINAELAKLPGFEKAYVDAKNKGDDAAAKAASDGYTASTQAIFKDYSQLVAAMQGAQGLNFQLGMLLGDDADKVSKEKDVVAVQAQIDARVKTVEAAIHASVDAVAPIVNEAGKAAAQRLQLEKQKIMDEELSNAVINHLQTKLAE